MNGAEIVVAPSIEGLTKNLKWKHKYDRMVFLSLQGWTLEQISDEIGCSPNRVSVVLCSRAGKEHLAEWSERLAERCLSTIEQGLVGLGPKAVENIAKTVNAEIPESASRRKQHQDKVSFELLGRIGFGRKETDKTPTESGLNGVPRVLQERLVAALEQSAEATRINEIPFSESEEVNDDPD